MDDFKINIVYQLEKDKAVKNSFVFNNRMQRKYDLSIEECTITYRKIVNYQVKKYGQSLGRKI